MLLNAANAFAQERHFWNTNQPTARFLLLSIILLNIMYNIFIFYSFFANNFLTILFHSLENSLLIKGFWNRVNRSSKQTPTFLFECFRMKWNENPISRIFDNHTNNLEIIYFNTKKNMCQRIWNFARVNIYYYLSLSRTVTQTGFDRIGTYCIPQCNKITHTHENKITGLQLSNPIFPPHSSHSQVTREVS